MTLPPRWRRFVLVTHIATSVGWLGAVLAYLALDITAVTTSSGPLARAAYLTMDVIVWSAIVPLALASVLVGVTNALVTPWGLFRHYWVLAKLVLTLFATTVLVIETATVSRFAELARSGSDARELPGTLPHSIGGTVVLLVVLGLSVYKPRGLTRHGWRLQQAATKR